MLTDEQRDVIAEAKAIDILVARKDLDLDEFTRVDNDKIHRYMPMPTAYCNGSGGQFLFRNASEKRRKTFFYYLGAESEAECVWCDGEWSLYEGVSEGRIEQCYDEDELTLAEALSEKIEGSSS